MKNLFLMVFLIFCLLAPLLATTGTGSEGAENRPPVSEETEACIECHVNYTPGIVEDWLKSRHAAITSEDAVKKPEASRRVSAQTFADSIGSVAVGCYECHSLNASVHKDNFDHAGIQINMVVSPNDCKTCHTVEVEQYMDSKKAHAVGTLRENPVYTALVETIIGLKTAQDGKTIRSRASESTKQETCFACHGTEVKVEGMREISTDVGDFELPILTNWPNQGVGRLNPDGSRGACTACHPRHSFSIEVARKPYTCAQCHLDPDVPAWNVYKESKHGNIYFSKYHEWKWDEVPWKLGEDFNAPTCSTCHNSLVANSDGGTIVPRTHDFGDRLWVRAFGLIYSHPQPKNGDTYIIKNKDGLPMPVTFSGELASEYLIGQEEQAKRQAAMESLCKSCHGSTWVKGHFAKMDSTFAETDKMVATATHVLSETWKAGLADNSNPFDEAIEQKWIKQWLFYASSVRYASAMTGAPDYAAFRNGWWDLTGNLQEMQSLAALKSDKKESPPEAAGDTSSKTEADTTTADKGFGKVDLSKLPEADRKYLGLKDSVKPVLGNVEADLIIVEFLSVYCSSCQMQSPVFNKLYSAMEQDPVLRGKVKMIGIGAGNNEREVKNFREERNTPFPILPDPKFAVYEELANGMRTPYNLLLKKDKAGNLVLIKSHMGLIRAYEPFLDEIKAALGNDGYTEAKKMEKAKDEAGVEPDLRLSEEELMIRVKKILAATSGDENISVAIRPVSLPDNPKVYEGKGKSGRYLAVVINRESVCDICHPVQFIYVLDERGKITDFEPIYLTKRGNKEWSEENIEKMRRRIVGRSVLQSIDFDPEVDAVTSATITSAMIFRAISQGREILEAIKN